MGLSKIHMGYIEFGDSLQDRCSVVPPAPVVPWAWGPPTWQGVMSMSRCDTQLRQNSRFYFLQIYIYICTGSHIFQVFFF